MALQSVITQLRSLKLSPSKQAGQRLAQPLPVWAPWQHWGGLCRQVVVWYQTFRPQERWAQDPFCVSLKQPRSPQGLLQCGCQNGFRSWALEAGFVFNSYRHSDCVSRRGQAARDNGDIVCARQPLGTAVALGCPLQTMKTGCWHRVSSHTALHPPSRVLAPRRAGPVLAQSCREEMARDGLSWAESPAPAGPGAQVLIDVFHNAF